MCGIAGVIAFNADMPAASSLVGAMCHAIVHRGPDDSGIATHGDCTLGMRRLAIVDLAGGHQPMANEDESMVIVYNGEIYNAPAVRLRLEREGVHFRTRSDTEVILRLYERNPAWVEQELVGMWAFAIHDRLRRRVVLSRDRFGMKPLFIADTGKAIAFASELRCFEKLRSEPRFASLFRVDEGAVHAMLSWGYVPDTKTIFQGVQRLCPSTRLEIQIDSTQRTQTKYWELQPSLEAQSVQGLEEACDFIEPLLRRAVREHLESDVSVATFLSGGIDSALITAYAIEQSSQPIESYSIGFRESLFDETPYANATAQAIGIQHKVTYLDNTIARRAVVDALLAHDEPFGDSSGIATLLLSRVVAKDHKVALGGDGGDEIFAGYRKHRIIGLRQMLAHVPSLQKAALWALSSLPVRMDRTSPWSDTVRTLNRVARGLVDDDAEAYLALTQVASLAKTSCLVRTPASPGAFVESTLKRFNSSGSTQLARTLACDLSNPLPNDMLTKVDRATMASSLEARVPFLDHRVVEAGLGLPAVYTLGHSGKEVLRALHERRFGKALARRRKQGFSVPVEGWLRGSLTGACEELFATDRLDRYGFLASETLGDGRWKIWAQRNPQVLWHAFAFAVWCEASLGEGAEAVRSILKD